MGEFFMLDIELSQLLRYIKSCERIDSAANLALPDSR